ncbi:MAG TPA: hypothetical protein VF345_02485 [Chthoniobacterales bacterium]
MSKISTQSGGHRIRIDKYTTSRIGKHPAISVLHGAGGTLLDGPEMRCVARQLAAAGNTVYLVHYFNRTGIIVALDAGMVRSFANEQAKSDRDEPAVTFNVYAPPEYPPGAKG